MIIFLPGCRCRGDEWCFMCAPLIDPDESGWFYVWATVIGSLLGFLMLAIPWVLTFGWCFPITACP